MGNRTVSTSGGVQQGRTSMEPKNSVSFTLNGAPVNVDGVSPSLTLNSWLRSQPGLTGTKKMCGEGGCGCCVVAVSLQSPDWWPSSARLTEQEVTFAINSCLCPLLSVEGWKITTIEGIGSSRAGYHPVQQKLAEFNGSQCGYCSPGFVMNMYSFLQENPTPTAQQIADIFDGNICRCTGYRPILDAMSTFKKDNQEDGVVDIEDIRKNLCPRTGKACTKPVSVCVGGHQESSPLWYAPTSMADLWSVFSTHADSSIRLVAGDTGRGVFKNPPAAEVYIDLKHIPDLYTQTLTDSSLTVGSAIPLNMLIETLRNNSDRSPSTFYLLADHLSKIANVPVRNVGSWAGNLMLTHDHDNFPSDVFVVMAAVGATLSIATASETKSVSFWDFLALDMSKSVIVSMEIPFASADTVFRSYKIMPRSENAHAYVNAAFAVRVDSSNSTVTGKPTLVYGGIEAHDIQATATASVLEGAKLLEQDTLKSALASLENEIVPNTTPVSSSAKYRKSLALGLFYKFYLSTISEHVDPQVKSATVPFQRPPSTGSQSYGTNPNEYPITKPMTKLTALLQTSGEAEYTTDVPIQPAECAAAFVLSPQGNSKITGVDFSKAEGMPGFIKGLTASDIPGTNNFMPLNTAEEVLVSDFCDYAGQPVAIIVAETQQQADEIALAVVVSYESQGKQLLTIADAIEADSYFENPGGHPIDFGDAKDAIAKSARKIEGTISCDSQYHFHMETQNSFVLPQAEGYTVYSSSQWPQYTQAAVATVLGINSNDVDVSVRRVGGAYGAKISRAHWIAAGCALAAHATGRPVRMHLDIDTNMKMIGKRFPYYATYTVGSTEEGILNGIEMTLYNNCGCNNNDNAMSLALPHIDNAYHVPNWLVTPKACKTNLAANTATRSPGTCPATFVMESVIDQVAKTLGRDPDDVRKANLYQKDQITPVNIPLIYCNISTLWDDLYKSADVETRKAAVVQFNQENRWRKRGLSMVPVRFWIDWNSAPYTIHISIYAVDGTVAICHGGIEVGQGINTKVAQVAAKMLGIPVDSIKIKPTNTLIGPNDVTTGGSITSELCCLGTIKACNELNERIAPVRTANPEASWQQLMTLCSGQGINLSVESFVYEKTEYEYAYNVYAVACTEVEIDVLTGEPQILRVDMLYDCGDSINPDIDIGQIEGAFTMGLGYWLTEKLIFNNTSGELLTHNTWEYKPPASKDIPIDFRVSLLRNAPNPVGILGSKAVGEPPLCLSCSALFAIKRAIENVRAEIKAEEVFTLDGPATVEDTQLDCLVDPSQFYF